MEQALLLDHLVDALDHEHMTSPTPVLGQVKPGETYEAPEQELSDLWEHSEEMKLRAKAMEQHGKENERPITSIGSGEPGTISLREIEGAMILFVQSKAHADLQPYLMDGSKVSELLSQSLDMDPWLLEAPEIVSMFENVVQEELQSRAIAMANKVAEEKQEKEVIVISDDDASEAPKRSSIRGAIAKKKKNKGGMVGIFIQAIKKHGKVEPGDIVQMCSYDRVSNMYQLSWETQPGSGVFDERIPGNVDWGKEKGNWIMLED